MDSFEIARLAGVSRKTVQRVLNNSASVKPETRDKILRLMETHRYEPNSAARKLSSRRTHTIGLFIVQDKSRYTLHTDDLFFGPVIGAIISRCSALGYSTLVTMLDVSDTSPMFSMFRQKSIDAGIIVSWSDMRDTIEKMREAHYRIGLFDEGFFCEAPTVVPIPHLDNRRSAYNAATYLLDLGHRKLGIVTGDLSNNTAKERFDGFGEALRTAGISMEESYVHYGAFAEEDGARAVTEWLAEGGLPEAIFCCNDLMAYGALKALSGHGISVPEQVSVIGFDDLLVSQYTHPPLTTMRVPRVEMAVQVTDCLITGLEDEPESTSRSTFLAELTERRTCAPRMTNIDNVSR